MHNKVLSVLFLLAFSGLTVAKEYSVTSPDKKILVNIDTSGKHLRYSVSIEKNLVIDNAQADISLSHAESLSTASVVSVDKKYVDSTITPYIKQKTATINEHYHHLALHFDNGTTIEYRVFDEGVAYRFSTNKSGKFSVENEVVKVNFVDDHLVQYPLEKSFYSHNERTYQPFKLKEINNKQMASLPLLVDTQQFKLVFTESGLRNYPGLWVRGTSQTALEGIHPKRVLSSTLKPGSDRNEVINKRANDIATMNTGSPTTFPWRIFAISKNDAELLTNQLSYLLADELEIDDPSWIKPGKVAWDWWNANNVYGVDFKAGINTDTYKYYIDFASKYGIEYIILDEGWYELGDALKIVDTIDLQEIIKYGREKGVDVILWVIWETIEEDLDHILATYQQWGAKGIKVDFMQRDDQHMVNYYWRVAEVAAKHQLLVNFHGSYKPAGLRRAYPNVITREGVRGLEHNKWAEYITAEHNLTLPFIRMVAGPMDYTPGAMVNTQPENFHVSFNRPMSKTTRVHQMALYVVFESPLQMLADSPSNYLKEHESTAFISQVPTVWDETVILSAKIADHIVIARRSGEEWFVAALGNSKAANHTIDLNFLSEGEYQMEFFQDGVNADKYASDYKKKYQSVNQHSSLSVHLAPSGGWVARISKKQSKH